MPAAFAIIYLNHHSRHTALKRDKHYNPVYVNTNNSLSNFLISITAKKAVLSHR